MAITLGSSRVANIESKTVIAITGVDETSIMIRQKGDYTVKFLLCQIEIRDMTLVDLCSSPEFLKFPGDDLKC